MKLKNNKRLPPFNEHLGFTILDWCDGKIIIFADVRPEHCNHSLTPHGGFIATILDAAAALSGTYNGDSNEIRRALTVTLHINFVGQAQTARINAIGEVTASDQKMYFSAARVYDMKDNLLATGLGIFRYRNGSEGL